MAATENHRPPTNELATLIEQKREIGQRIREIQIANCRERLAELDMQAVQVVCEVCQGTGCDPYSISPCGECDGDGCFVRFVWTGARKYPIEEALALVDEIGLDLDEVGDE